MANEIKLAKAARAIARELLELPEGSPHPFGTGQVFDERSKDPCCAIGHVISRAQLDDLVPPSCISGLVGLTDCTGRDLPTQVAVAIYETVEANDSRGSAQEVAESLYALGDALELSAAASISEES